MSSTALPNSTLPTTPIRSAHAAQRAWWVSAAGAIFCLLTLGLFYYTVFRLYLFLRDGVPIRTTASLALDIFLALQFALPHSLLLWPTMRRRLNRWIPNSFYGLAFTAVSSVSLLAVFELWQPFGRVLWQAHGWTAALIGIGYHASFLALAYSMWITGMGHQTGTTAWLAWWRDEKPTPRKFEPAGAYRLFRHPIYLSFAGLIWFTPTMTADHALLTGLWTAYLLLGSWIKDERLAFFIGTAYRQYQSRVPGYPGMPQGPFGRRRSEVS